MRSSRDARRLMPQWAAEQSFPDLDLLVGGLLIFHDSYESFFNRINCHFEHQFLVAPEHLKLIRAADIVIRNCFIEGTCLKAYTVYCKNLVLGPQPRSLSRPVRKQRDNFAVIRVEKDA